MSKRFSILLVVLTIVSGLISVLAQAPQKVQIVFSSNRDGNDEIYVMDSDGKNPHNLTDNPAGEGWATSWFDPAYAKAVSSAGKLGTTWAWIKQKGE